MLYTFFKTRGSALLILLFLQFCYIYIKDYNNNILYYVSGLSYVETGFLVVFYFLFRGIQKKNIKAKFYALLPLIFYYFIYEYYFIQFGAVLKFQDFFLLLDFFDVLPIIEMSGVIFIVILPLVLIIKNIRTKWQYIETLPPIIFLLFFYSLLTTNRISELVYENFHIQRFSQEHVVAAYGPLSAAFIFENDRKKYILKGEKNNTFDIKDKNERSIFIPAKEKLVPNKNIHLIIVESFIDVRHFKKLPLSEKYLKVFDSLMFTNNSVSIAPGFGNGTARSEFEILCGVPSLQLIDSIEFNVLSGNENIDCLPEILNKNGYITLASHPFKPNYYNRVKAYKSLNFADVKFGSKYSLVQGGINIDDAPGGWLYDDSLYKQNINSLKALMSQDKPIFNYMLTTYGHYPFDRDYINRPDIIKVDDVNKEVNRLINQIYYRVYELNKYIKTLNEIDPNSLIVVVGDHLPPLTTGKLMYDKLGYSNQINTNKQFTYHQTPLFITNKQQVLSVPKIRHFNLFYIILNTLYEGNFCKKNKCQHQNPEILLQQYNKNDWTQEYMKIMRQGMM